MAEKSVGTLTGVKRVDRFITLNDTLMLILGRFSHLHTINLYSFNNLSTITKSVLALNLIPPSMGTNRVLTILHKLSQF